MRSNRQSLVLSSCVMSWPQGHTPLSAPVFWKTGAVLTHFPVSIHGYKVSASSPLIKYMLIIILADAEGRLSATLRYTPKKIASLIRSNKIQNKTLWVESRLLLEAGKIASSKENPAVRGQYQLSLPRAQPKLLFPLKILCQFSFCKICQLGARQKCGFGKDFQGVSVSWFSQHKGAEGRGKE